MSATPSPEVAGSEAWWSSARHGRAVDIAVAGLVLIFVALMLLFPEFQAIPYHLVFLTLIFAYGMRVWPVVPTLVVFVVIFLVTGAVEVRAYVEGDGHGDVGELFEVLLMPAILGAMMWTTRRRRAAEDRARAAAVRHSDVREAETQFLRETAHALRNPVAVARGWIDLGEDRWTEPEHLELCERVRGELDRIDRMAGNLLDIAAHPDEAHDLTERVDLAEIAAAAVARWHRGAERVWRLDADSGVVVEGSPARLGDALDALVENALRFTRDGDVVRVICRSHRGEGILAVADGGPGIRTEDRPRVFDRFWRGSAPDGTRGTGLGLAMVAVVAQQFGGHAWAGAAPEGGAFVGIALPLADSIVAVDVAVPRAREAWVDVTDGVAARSDAVEVDVRST